MLRSSVFTMMEGREESAGGAGGRRMIFFAENAQSWNSLLPVARRLRQRADVVLSTLAVSCPVAEDYQKWPYTSKASEDTFRDLYVPIDEARVLPWDIFVLTH